jgi:hypothetical protein
MKRISKKLAKFDAFGCVWFRGPVCSYLPGKILIKIKVVEIQQPDRRLKQSSFRALSHPPIASGYGSMPMLGHCDVGAVDTVAGCGFWGARAWESTVDWAEVVLIGRTSSCYSFNGMHISWYLPSIYQERLLILVISAVGDLSHDTSWHPKNHWARMENSNETRGFASALPWPMAVRQCPGQAWS